MESHKEIVNSMLQVAAEDAQQHNYPAPDEDSERELIEAKLSLEKERCRDGFGLIQEFCSDSPSIEELKEAWKKLEEPATQESNSSLSEVLNLSPEQLQSFYSLAYERFEACEYSDALAVYTFLSSVSPDKSAFHVAKGRCFEALEDKDSAMEAYQLARYAEPWDIDAYLPGALLLTSESEFDEAILWMGQALQVAEALPQDEGEALNSEAGQVLKLIEQERVKAGM